MRFLISFLVVVSSFAMEPCYSQKGDVLVRTVLKKNKISKVFLFDSSTKRDGLYKIYITYLGIINVKGKQYKIVNAKTVWGPNKHTSGTILMYDIRNHYFGKYHLGGGSDLPRKIEKNQLLFNNTDKEDCDPKLITRINFDVIPQEIFIKCKGEYGDVYSFSTEKD